MKRQPQAEEISFFTFKKDLHGYKKSTLFADAYAAVTVAMLTVPQAMACAMLAGLPISSGIFAAIYSSLIACIFGSSRHLVIGTSNAIAILVQAGISEIIYTYYRDISPGDIEILSLQILTTLTLLIGFFQVLGACLKLGRISQFISHSVVVGYIIGTTIAVIINQFFPLFGIPSMPGVHSLYERGVYLVSNLNQFHIPTAIVGFFSLGLVIALKKASKRIPAAFIMLVLAGVFIHVANLLLNFLGENFYSFGFHANDALQGIQLIGDNGGLSDIAPQIMFPFFDMRVMNALLPTAFAIALLSVMETSTAAKSIAANSGQRLSSNQEIFGIGLGNLTSSFISGLPVAGSPMRSAINYQSGAETRVSAILSVIFVISVLLVFNYFITLIPLAALAALLLTNSLAALNKNQFLLCLKSTSSDAMVLGVTIFSCIFFSFDIAFYIGVGISITLYLKKAAIPQLVEFEVDESGELKNVSYSNVHHHRSIRVIKVEGELFFGAADLFQSTLKAIAEDDTHTRVIILQLKNARDIDATACLALCQLHKYLRGSGRHLIACGITEAIWDVLNDSGLIDILGKDNLFAVDAEKHYMQKAIKRANELQAPPVTVEVIEEDVVVVEEVQEEVMIVDAMLENPSS